MNYFLIKDILMEMEENNAERDELQEELNRIQEIEVLERSKRIAQVRKAYCEDSNTVFAEKLGKDPTYTSQLCTGSKPAGRKILLHICKAFPQMNREWLLYGFGSMEGRPEGDKEKENFVAERVKDKYIAAMEPSRKSETVAALDEKISLLEAQLAEKDKYIAAQKETIDSVKESIDLLKDSFAALKERTEVLMRVARESVNIAADRATNSEEYYNLFSEYVKGISSEEFRKLLADLIKKYSVDEQHGYYYYYFNNHENNK